MYTSDPYEQRTMRDPWGEPFYPEENSYQTGSSRAEDISTPAPTQMEMTSSAPSAPTKSKKNLFGALGSGQKEMQLPQPMSIKSRLEGFGSAANQAGDMAQPYLLNEPRTSNPGESNFYRLARLRNMMNM